MVIAPEVVLRYVGRLLVKTADTPVLVNLAWFDPLTQGAPPV